jgi:hypothetical protein
MTSLDLTAVYYQVPHCRFLIVKIKQNFLFAVPSLLHVLTDLGDLERGFRHRLPDQSQDKPAHPNTKSPLTATSFPRVSSPNQRLISFQAPANKLRLEMERHLGKQSLSIWQIPSSQLRLARHASGSKLVISLANKTSMFRHYLLDINCQRFILSLASSIPRAIRAHKSFSQFPLQTRVIVLQI